MVVFIAVIGVGGVGKCFLRQLEGLTKRRPSAGLRLCYLSNSTRALYSDDHAPVRLDTALEQLAKTDREPLPLGHTLVDYLASAPGPTVLVDNTSSGQVAEMYPLALGRGIHVVTPNKKAFSGPLQAWEDIQAAAISSGACVLHESSVGAGLPVISTLTDLVETGDQVDKIEGVFSGTMSFLFNSFSPHSEGASTSRWSDEVQRAKALGYTEPDPREDLNGMDVARKLTILARLSGLPVQSASSFPVESLIPSELEGCSSGDEFLSRLPDFDTHMDRLREAAQSDGQVIRYVGRIDMAKSELTVGLQRFPRSHPMAGLRGSDNLISFYTRRYGDNPLIIQGAGAGGEVTAMGVMCDLLKILRKQSR